MTDYAVAITFPQNATTYEALSKMQSSGGYTLDSAVIVERDASGKVSVADGGDGHSGAGFAGGGLIGLLVGVLGGPIGMLLGWSVGAATGSLVDANRLDKGDAAVDEFSRTVPPSHNAIFAETHEDSTAALDRVVADLGGTITRRPAGEVVAELEAQQKAAEEAQKAARKQLHEEKQKEHKDSRQKRVDDLKAKFHHGDGAKASS